MFNKISFLTADNYLRIASRELSYPVVVIKIPLDANFQGYAGSTTKLE